MNAGLELARTTGVHIWEHLTIVHGVSGCLNRGDIVLARQLLDTLERDLSRARDMDRLYYYHARAWFALLNDDVVAAHAFQEQALASAARTGIVFGQAHAHFGMALVLHESHDAEGAAQHLGAARRLATALGGGMPGGSLRSRGGGVRARRRRRAARRCCSSPRLRAGEAARIHHLHLVAAAGHGAALRCGACTPDRGGIRHRA